MPRVFASLRLAALVALAPLQPLSAVELPVYSDAVLAEWQGRYPNGILSNYNEVILPNLDAADRHKLEGVGWEFPLRMERQDPFGFVTDTRGRVIRMSIKSLKFLDDAAIASAWLNRNGYSPESLLNYLTMLTNWESATPPPAMLPTLCVPDDVLENKEVDELAQKTFATAIFFIMLHEIGHIVHGHAGGYEGVDPALSREREKQADAYALKVLARVGDPPLGVVNMFLIQAYLHERRTDFSSDEAYAARLAQITHPLSADRLVAFSDALQASASRYTGTGLTRVTIAAMAGEVRIVASNFRDIQRLIAMIGNTITPSDLGPIRPGEKIGTPCTGNMTADGPFSGRLAGTLTLNGVEFDVETLMTREGDTVTGKYSFGAGFFALSGVVRNDTLHYSWDNGRDNGKGVLTYANGAYSGRWGNGNSDRNGGSLALRGQ